MPGLSCRNACLLAVAVVLLAGCATGAARPDPDPGPVRVWPESLESPARIAYLRSFARPEDLGIRPGMWHRISRALFGETPREIDRPMSVVTTADAIFVADPGRGGVHRFDTARSRYDLLQGPEGAAMPSPVGLAAAPDGTVFVSDSALGQVLAIAPGATAAVPLPLAGLVQPTGLAVDARTGDLYVVDTAAHVVRVYGPDGQWRRTFGRRGRADGEFNFPTFAWCDAAGRLYVNDSLNYRVQRFGPGGDFEAAFGRPGDATGDFMRPKGLASDAHGHLYVADGLAGVLQVFDGDGRVLLVVGEMGSGPGEFWLPEGVFVAGEEIYVADSFNHRVQVFRYLGEAP